VSSEQPDWAFRYARADAMLHAAAGVANGAVFPHWIDDERFWYRRSGGAGIEYRIVDAASGRMETVEAPPASGAEPGVLISPDRRWGVSVRNGNLWLRDLAGGGERALTHDGEERNAYAVKPAAFRLLNPGRPELPEACWSPDSSRLFTLRTDERRVTALPLVDFAPRDGLRPEVRFTPTSAPTDRDVTEFRLVVIDIATAHHSVPDHRRLPAVRMNDTVFSAGLAWWSAAGQSVYFVDSDRGERAVRLVEWEIDTGRTRALLTETDHAYIDLGPNVYEPALVRPLPDTDELIWYSERSGYGHLYLYELTTGRLKHQLTDGAWQVHRILHVDAGRRDVLLLGGGLAPDEGPYAAKPCLVSLDGGAPRLVSDAAGDHVVWPAQPYVGLSQLELVGEDPAQINGVSPAGGYFIETVGTPHELPRTVLRTRTGEEIAVLEVASGDRLPPDWTWPEPVRCRAADGSTELYGLLFRPPEHDPEHTYPLIDFIYPGPQMSQIPRSAFARGGIDTDLQLVEAAHLASLGAFVLLLDARGTSGRSREFHLTSYGAVQDASNLEDHVAAIRELAGHDPSIDLDRVAVTGFSAGGYAAAHAALRFGDFFKIAVAGGGNYDMRLFWHTWGDRYHGGPDPARWEAQAAKSYAGKLTGRLLIIHGLLDPACHPAGMFQLAQALIDAGQDFDLVIEPRQGHALGGHGLRKRLDYFVTHLFGDTPPSGVRITPPLQPPPATSERRTQ